MNKQSNTYTIIYIVVLVAIVGAALAITAEALKPKQQANQAADKMRQILYAVHLSPETADLNKVFNECVAEQKLVNDQGEEIMSIMTSSGDNQIFDIDVAAQSKLPESERKLPVFVCTLKNGEIKYVLPVAGMGLWGAIWGYVAVDSDGSTIYGAYFSHASETPGLGAEIEKPAFQDRFIGKQLIKDNAFYPIAVVKAGQHPSGNEDYVDGVSGGTITSKGVGTMLDNCLTPYRAFLERLKNGKAS